MRTIAPLILFVGILLQQSTVEEVNPYAPAEPYFFSTNLPTCFFSDHLTGAWYSKFSPNGRYVRIAKEHLGVWPFDEGSWTQSSDGIITLISTNLCADIICEPLEISIGRHDSVKHLPELRRKIDNYLAANVKDEYSKDDLKNLAIREYFLEVEIDWRAERKTVTRAEMLALVKAIDDFINNPSRQNERLIPLSYRGQVFLVSLNEKVSRDYKEVCRAIDEGPNSRKIIYNDFMVPEEQFNKGIEKPYPFKYYPEMNKITGAE